MATLKVDGRKQMAAVPKPLRYYVVIDKKTGKPVEAFRPVDFDEKTRREYFQHPKLKVEGRYYANDEAFTDDTGLSFPD